MNFESNGQKTSEVGDTCAIDKAIIQRSERYPQHSANRTFSCSLFGLRDIYNKRGFHMSSHLFVQDADEEEPLARSQSCPSLAGTDQITLLQSLEALEALMSWTEHRETQWNGKAMWIKARQHAVASPLTKSPYSLSGHSFFCSLPDCRMTVNRLYSLPWLWN